MLFSQNPGMGPREKVYLPIGNFAEGLEVVGAEAAEELDGGEMRSGFKVGWPEDRSVAEFAVNVQSGCGLEVGDEGINFCANCMQMVQVRNAVVQSVEQPADHFSLANFAANLFVFSAIAQSGG